jgi:hypothetical protein
LPRLEGAVGRASTTRAVLQLKKAARAALATAPVLLCRRCPSHAHDSFVKAHQNPDTENLGASAHICASCRKVVSGDGRSWVFIRMISRSVTTIWLCPDCLPTDATRCAVCSTRQPVGRIPLCTECLFEYESALRDARATKAD